MAILVVLVYLGAILWAAHTIRKMHDDNDDWPGGATA